MQSFYKIKTSILSSISQLILTSICFSFFSACATRLPVAEGIKNVSGSEYEDIVRSKTQKVEVYDGLYNQLTVAATRLDGEMTEYSLAYSAKIMQWPLTKYTDEKNKAISKGTQSSDFFVSFYTPERKHNDLASSKSIWKIYMDIDGQRYEGKATKIKGQYSEVQAMYPEHSRWAVGYIVEFPIAAALSDKKPLVLTFTGPVTTTQLRFQ